MMKEVRGVVRGGVIVPDEPLPEGYLVFCIAGPPHFTPEEQGEFDALSRASAEALLAFEESLAKEPVDAPR